MSRDKPHVTFVDVVGVDEAKQELTEVVEFLNDSEKLAALGARIPMGVLMGGPPGAAKALLTKAAAEEAGIPSCCTCSAWRRSMGRGGTMGNGQLSELTRAVVHRATSLLERKGGRADGT